MCGIVGIYSNQPVAAELYDSLVHLQHRGQDAAGIMTYDRRFHFTKGKGLVRDVFTTENISQLTGRIGIAHSRYPTAGTNSDEEIQPFRLCSPYGIALVHNGNIVNAAELSEGLRKKSLRHLNTSSDSEILLHLFAGGLEMKHPAEDTETLFEQICTSLFALTKQAQGSYSVVCLMMGKGLIAFRDPHGLRPLVYGSRKNKAGGLDYIFASETTMFHSLGFTDIKNVPPGGVIFIDEQGHVHERVLQKKAFTPCIFEYVYFARPDSLMNDISVYRARLRMGQNLAKAWKQQHPNVIPDIVIPAPYTSNTAALSFAHELGVRYSEGLYKNPFIGRTFIMPGAEQRKRSVRYKLTPQEFEIRDKNVLILDDSIVRGTTSKEIINMLRETGAKKVYFATTCPPVKFPCFYGIDIPTRAELIASNKTLAEIKNYLNVDILLYQNITDLVEAVTRRGEHHIDNPCMACLDGNYVCGNINENTMPALEARRIQERDKK